MRGGGADTLSFTAFSSSLHRLGKLRHGNWPRVPRQQHRGRGKRENPSSYALAQQGLVPGREHGQARPALVDGVTDESKAGLLAQKHTRVVGVAGDVQQLSI